MTALRAPEVRTFASLELREVDSTDSLTYLEGRAVPYGEFTNVGWYLEQIAQGAFEKSTREAAKSLPLLLWHDNRTWPIGLAESWTHEDDGMRGVWKLDGSDEAQRGARMARDGYLVGMSVGFSPIKSEWEMAEDWDPENEESMDRCTRVEARLHEVSLTPTPAYAGASVELVRSADKRATHAPTRRATEVDSWRRWLDTVKRPA